MVKYYREGEKESEREFCICVCTYVRTCVRARTRDDYVTIVFIDVFGVTIRGTKDVIIFCLFKCKS